MALSLRHNNGHVSLYNMTIMWVDIVIGSHIRAVRYSPSVGNLRTKITKTPMVGATKNATCGAYYTDVTAPTMKQCLR